MRLQVSDEYGRMHVVKFNRVFAVIVKKSGDHFVDYFIGLSMAQIGPGRSFLLFRRNLLSVENAAIRENRTAPGFYSESHFLVEMVCFPNSLFP